MTAWNLYRYLLLTLLLVLSSFPLTVRTNSEPSYEFCILQPKKAKMGRDNGLRKMQFGFPTQIIYFCPFILGHKTNFSRLLRALKKLRGAYYTQVVFLLTRDIGYLKVLSCIQT